LDAFFFFIASLSVFSNSFQDVFGNTPIIVYMELYLILSIIPWFSLLVFLLYYKSNTQHYVNKFNELVTI